MAPVWLAADLLGRARGEIVGQRFHSFIAREDQDGLHLGVQRLLAGESESDSVTGLLHRQRRVATSSP